MLKITNMSIFINDTKLIVANSFKYISELKLWWDLNNNLYKLPTQINSLKSIID